MSQVIFELESELARKLNSFIQSYADKEGLIEKFLDFYRNQLRREISHMNFDLRKFEEKYRMSSEDFITRFSEGELDDSNDFQIWSGVWEMRKESEDKLKSLS